jgi:hypothetical protein
VRLRATTNPRTLGGTTHMNLPTRAASMLSSVSAVVTLGDVMVATEGGERGERGAPVRSDV